MAFGNSGNGSTGFDLLNLTPHKVSTEIEGNILVYGDPKIGKTSFCYNMWKDKALVVATERGYNYLDGVFAIDVTKFSDMNKIIRELKKDAVKERFKVVIIDTLDILEKLAVKYVCDRAGVQDLSGLPFGKLYSELDKEIENIILSISREGYQIAMISHSIRKSSMTDEDITYITNTTSKRISNLVSKFCDHILYLSSEKDEEGNEKRYIHTRGTSEFKAGSRISTLPAKIELNADVFKEEVRKAIEGISDDLTDEKVSNIPEPLFKEETFEEIMDRVVKIVTEKFMPNDRMDVVTEITDRNLGIGKKIGECDKKNKESLEIIECELLDKVDELGL